MKALIAVLLFLLAGPVWAGERIDELNRIGPLSERERLAFDRIAIESMFEDKCNCYLYVHRGVLRGFDAPLTDGHRRLLMNGIRDGLITPGRGPKI